MTDVVVERLRLPGRNGRRMAGIAATWLPDALDRSFADLDDARLGRLRVVLDFDPRDYDDQTVALLLADRIRQAAEQAGARVRSRAGAIVTGAEVTGSPGAGLSLATARRPAMTRVLAILRSWLAVPDRGPLPAAVLRVLATPGATEQVLAELDPTESATLTAALVVAEPVPHTARGRSPTSGPRRPERVATPDARNVPERRIPPHPVGVPGSDQVDEAPEAGAAAREPAPAILMRRAAGSALRERRSQPDQPPAVSGALVTSVAGLVLLAPWLSGYCRDAAQWLPGLGEIAQRRTALARLASPDRAWLVADPLVCLLAGLPPGDSADPPALAPVDDGQSHLDALATATLGRFAGALPGFATSSPAFVREQWITRFGTIEPATDPVLVTLDTLPLDVVLATLPYPLGLFGLPWTPPIAIRFAT